MSSMTPERWQQIDEVFQAATALEPSARAAFLENACGADRILYDKVSAMLVSDDGGWDLIEHPALEVGAPFLADDRPQLTPEQHIGRYQITHLIGRGGMGEVYLARDKRLNRKVALKLLSIDYVSQHRLRRFEQEAQAASALNHPNILTIYEIGQIDDQQFIATEFVDGETLRERLKRGPLNISEALDVAIQIGGALAASHHAGIVHSDIKPENIMLRPDGYVKVVDFGLAKLTEQTEPTTKPEAGEDVDTSSGLVMGTVRYMSPEQAQGKSVDARSDIFSLGVVLYEMLTGRMPFKGKSTADLIKSILKDEPVPLSQFVPELPMDLERILGQALAKNRAERYEKIYDLLAAVTDLRRKLEIGRALDGITHAESSVVISRATHSPGSEVPTAAATQSLTQQVVSRATQHKLQTSFTLLIVMIAAGGFFYASTKLWRQRPAFHEVKMSQLVETDKSRFAAVSPDGKYIAHTIVDANKQSLLLRPTATNSSTVLVPPTDAWFNGVTFSRDGNYVYYLMWGKDDSTYALYQVSVSGGDSQKVLANVASPITFSTDGRRFAFVRIISKEETGLFIANSDGADERLLGKPHSSNFFSAAGPSWSPDGKLIACAVFDEHPKDSTPFMSVVGVNVKDGTEKLLTNEKWSRVLQVAWLSDNSGFIIAATQEREGALLWHVSYPEGNSRRLTNDPSNYPSNYDSLSLTADSKVLVASRFELRTNLWAAPSGDPGQAKQITFGGNHRYKRLAWTPDGKIVFPSDASGNREIWIMEGDGSGQRQLTGDGRFNQIPAVSPDGRYIVFVSGRAGNPNIWRMNIDGSDPIQLTHGEDDFGPQCSPDGRWVFYTSVASEKATVWRVSIDGGEAVQLTKEVSTWPVLSPDGRWFACWWWSSPESPAKIGLFPFVEGNSITSMDAAPGAASVTTDQYIRRIVQVKFVDPVPGATSLLLPMRWTSDGRALIYCVTRNNISNIWSQPIDGGPPKQLTDFKSETIQGFDWSRDDRLLVSRGFTAREIVLVEDVSH